MHLKDGGFHPVDSSAIAFEIAARAAFKEGAGKAKPIVMATRLHLNILNRTDSPLRFGSLNFDDVRYSRATSHLSLVMSVCSLFLRGCVSHSGVEHFSRDTCCSLLSKLKT